MKTTQLLMSASLLLASTFTIAQEECQDVQIQSWNLNRTAELADYQTNCCPTTQTLTPVQMSDTAGVLEIWYNTNYTFIRSHSLAYFTMGPWATAMVPSAQDLLLKIPRTVTEDVSGTKNTAESGTIGVGVDGVVIFSETTSNSYNTANGNNTNGDGIWNEDAWNDEAWSLDTSGYGHTNAGGKYHYHASPIKLYSQTDNSKHSPIVGWAMDGAPIYGPFAYQDSMNSNSQLIKMKSSYQLRNISDRTTLADGTVLSSNQYGPSINDYALGHYVEDYEYIAGLGNLDEHNGRFCVTPEYPNGIYAYFVTEDVAGTPKYPYFIGPEFYGTTASGNSIPSNASLYDPASCMTTSVDDYSKGTGLSVFPNPSNGTIAIDLSTLSSDQVSISVVNSNGVLVAQNNTQGGQIYSIEIDAPAGLYHIQVSTSKTVYGSSIIVQP